MTRNSTIKYEEIEKLSLSDLLKINISDDKNNLEDVFTARELSGKSNLLFLRDSLSGKVIAKKNKIKSSLNKELHKND